MTTPGRAVEAGLRVVLATHNPGKVEELVRLLKPLKWQPVPAGALGLPPAQEGEEGYLPNARIKATDACRRAGLPALGDDTGLAVAELDGVPGVATARYAAHHGGWIGAQLALAQALGLPRPEVARASLHCALALAWPGGELWTGEAAIAGRVRWPPREGLPGLVAMFEPDEGEGPLERDGVLVHRRRAFDRLLEP